MSKAPRAVSHERSFAPWLRSSNRSRFGCAVLACLMLVLLACSGQSSKADGAPVGTDLLDCGDPIDILDAPPDGWETALGVVAFPDDQMLQRGRTDDDGRRFSKFGLVIRSERALTLTMSATSTTTAQMSWNNSGVHEPVSAIQIDGCSGLCTTDYQPNCPRGERGEWIVFPGGVWTTEPECVAIEVTADDQKSTVELPLGQDCPAS